MRVDGGGETTVPGMQRARLMNAGSRSLWHLSQFGVVWSSRTLLSRVCGNCVLSDLGLPSHCRLGLCLFQDSNAQSSEADLESRPAWPQPEGEP